MRGFFRRLVTAIWAIALILFAFTLETVVDALGWTTTVRNLVTNGWRSMSDAGYANLALNFFLLMSGAMAAVWIEFGLRRWEARKRNENWVHFTVTIKDGIHTVDRKVGLDTLTSLDGQAIGNIYQSDPQISENAIGLIIQFKDEVLEPCPYVCSDRKIIWREARSGSHYLMLDIDLLSSADAAFAIIVRPKSVARRLQKGGCPQMARCERPAA